MPPSTSEQIAAKTGLNERYVREWLGAMVTGGIIDYDPSTATYTLPPEHAASMTRAAGPGNLAAFAQFFAEIGSVETGIVDSFRNGGGVPYSQFPRFQELMREESAQVFDATLHRRHAAAGAGPDRRLKSGIDVADVGCGSGHAINLMAQRLPQQPLHRLRLLGRRHRRAAAPRRRTLALAERHVRSEGRRHARRLAAVRSDHDLRRRPRPGAAAPRAQGHPRCAQARRHLPLRRHRRLQQPRTTTSTTRMGPCLYTISTMHCMTVSLALGGEGLGTVWGEQKARELMPEAGFADINVAQVEGDIMNNYYTATRR